MTQEHISHPEGLPNCAAGHRARHIHDKRCASAGGGHLVECACRSTSKHADPEKAIAAWRRLNRPGRSARPAAVPAAVDNVVQMRLVMAGGGKVASAV
ncbi:hypothetical protein [Stenotrophomonas maltophilia]|uniref:hypothetical protein n=1 Tax=Stenotrophomonas maltophilia TaxID=40324 RepID=UPI00201CE06C|nr:hypothetical protein [Stenotrophomonas maltophilia]UQY95360.1 hypothetical protein LZ605_19945 [Stenotrophomonas maltophilia]